MTTKQMAEISGVSVDTITRVGKELFPSKYQKGKKTVFLQRESIAVLAEVRKKGFIQPTQTAEVPTQTAEVIQSNLTAKDFDMIGAIVASIMQKMEKRVEKIETRIEERQALLPAPQIKPRDHINKLVREYASGNKMEYRDVYAFLYNEFGYRTNTNPKICAKNRGMGTLDYIDAEGMLEILESVAMEVLK